MARKFQLFMQGYRDGARAAHRPEDDKPVALEGATFGTIVLWAWCAITAWAIAGAAAYIIWKVFFAPVS